MSRMHPVPLDEASYFGRDEIIVSKTDKQGCIVYANDVFCRMAELSTGETIGEAHNLIRHPDMPRVIFKLLWDTISAGDEIFAYIKNIAKSGKYYWVFAHVTPSFDAAGNIIGYHSNRRSPNPQALASIAGLYKKLLGEEKAHTSPKQGLEASAKMLMEMLEAKNISYSEFVWGLENGDV